MSLFIDLSGKKFLVVGASSGIGEGIAKGLAEMGGHVSALSRKGHAEGLSNVDKIEQISVDATNSEAIIDFIKRFDGVFSGLVYSAGVRGKSPITTITNKQINTVFDTNFTGFLIFIKELIRNKKIENGGSIVGISSISAHLGIEGLVPYSASKAAISSSARVLGRELAKRGIRINTISPAMVRTPIFLESEQEWLNEVEKSYPLGLGEVVDVAAAVAFYMSDRSKYITGTDLLMTGGCPWHS
jgi:NAD(P)-dependent dehydrogenase (short-subunit alcohol dehydrogenase family)